MYNTYIKIKRTKSPLFVPIYIYMNISYTILQNHVLSFDVLMMVVESAV